MTGAVGRRHDLRQGLVSALRQEGLDALLSGQENELLVGTANRGDLAVPAAVRLQTADAEEYLDALAAGWTGADPEEYAFGMLVMLLVESLSVVHDGANNLVTEVELRRGLEGRLGLHETRIDTGAPLLPPGDYGWSAER